YNNEKYVKNM
ncbi:peptide-transporting ATPase, partial [Escherichia coli 6.0172]